VKKYAFFFPVDKDLSLTGGPRTVINLLTGLQSVGHETVLLSQRESALTEELRKQGVEVEIVELPDLLDVHDEKALTYSIFQKVRSLVQLIKYNRRIAARCRKHEIDGLWGRNIKGVLFIGIAAHFLRVPLIWDIGYEKPGRGLMQMLHWLGFVLATCVVTQSERQFPETFGPRFEQFFGHKVKCIYPGIDTDRQAALQDSGEYEDGECRTVLSIGNIHPRKNQEMTIQALAPLLHSIPDLRLDFAGAVRDEDYYERLRTLVKDKNIEESVCFLGWRDDIPVLLGRSDLLVLSSLREGIPHVVREAMFAQVPVVATRIGGVPESVRHGETGYLVDADDQSSFREHVEDLIRDSEKRKKMGQNALQFGQERFSHSAWIETYSDFLEAA
jgi:glycosyltransferase involved in cell wall biosynthesis